MFDMATRYRYPVGEYHRDIVRSKTGKTLNQLSLKDVLGGLAKPEDFLISAEGLCRQADIAEARGFRDLAHNLRRASELAQMPVEKIIHLYNCLRPNRSTYTELMHIVDELENKFGAWRTAHLFREAAEVYRSRHLLLEPEESG
jgi:propanediol dehydratase small subunit